MKQEIFFLIICIFTFFSFFPLVSIFLTIFLIFELIFEIRKLKRRKNAVK